jgi:phage-related baseplate assembly protein
LPEISQLYNLPDISFVEKDVETLLQEMVAEYEAAFFAATGESKTLAAGDPVRIWIYAQALKIYAAYQLIDFTGKQNLLKYSSGEYLDHVGAGKGVTRLPSTTAIVTQRFTLSALQPTTIGIPLGTRVNPGNNIFFATTEYAEIPPGNLSVDIIAECADAGIIGNGFIPGQINILVDPIPFVASTENIDTSQRGADIEADDSLRERIYLRPESYSTAGPKGAYAYFAKAYSATIADVSVTSPSPGVVDIRFILQNGEMPDTAMINEVLDYLSDETRRPLTDQVLGGSPEQVDYDLELTYYIKTSDSSLAPTIQAAVNKAIDDYRLWQKTKIGRDINPDELSTRIKQAGAKRTVITTPVFTALTDIQIAKDVNILVTYGGLENE